MNRLKKIQGRWRLFWDLCPECNSDAPALDNCKVCDGFRRLDLHGIPPSPATKSAWWQRFTQERTLTNEEIDRILIRPRPVVMFFFGAIILRVARRIVSRAKERNFINSRSYHELLALIDRALK